MLGAGTYCGCGPSSAISNLCLAHVKFEFNFQLTIIPLFFSYLIIPFLGYFTALFLLQSLSFYLNFSLFILTPIFSCIPLLFIMIKSFLFFNLFYLYFSL